MSVVPCREAARTAICKLFNKFQKPKDGKLTRQEEKLKKSKYDNQIIKHYRCQKLDSSTVCFVNIKSYFNPIFTFCFRNITYLTFFSITPTATIHFIWPDVTSYAYNQKYNFDIITLITLMTKPIYRDSLITVSLG